MIRGRAVWRVFVACALFAPVLAHAGLTATPLTWNVVGLDSNDPASGPKYFPVGARVCTSTAAASVTANWVWDTANPNINLRAGSPSVISLGALAAGACADAYFEVELTQTVAAFDTTRRYRITATDGANNASTPVPRELYVEHLISQNRNAVTDVKLNGVSIPPGGGMNLVVGNTYTIEHDGGTATQGYSQFESFIDFPNTIFQILSVSTTYSADNSPWVPGPAPVANDKVYADACLWQNDPANPNYLSCVGGDFKAGGNDVRTTYTVKIIGGGGTAQTLNTLLYDFSGSSFHYNSDYSTSARIGNIIDPASAGIAKRFSPSTTRVNGVSTLTITLSNPNAGAVTGYNFTDPLPANMTVANPPSAATAGCGTPTLTAGAGATSISFANGTVAANGSCTISVNVTASAAATYTNTTGHLFVGATDTGNAATATLTVTNAPPPPVCTPGLELARWNMNGTTAGGIVTAPTYFSKSAQVSSALANFAPSVGATQSIVASGTPANAWGGTGWLQAGVPTAATTSYFEFTLDTSKFSGVGIRFDGNPIGPGDWGNPNNNQAHVWSSADGGAFALLAGFPQNMTKATWTTNLSGTAATTGTGTTTFRININGTNKATGVFAVDNVVFTGCGVPAVPTIAKTFLSNPVAVGAPSTLQFTLANPNPVALTGVKFSDALPAGMQVAATPAASTTCGGTPSWAPAGGAATLDFGQTTGASIPANSSCTVSVNVIATTAGPHTNVSGYISSTETGTNTGAGGSAVATLTAVSPPSMAKIFAVNPIVANGSTLLTFTITNPNQNDALTGLAFADTYPAGMTNVNPLTPPVANSCGGTVSAVAGGSGITLSGGTLAPGSACTITVMVTATAPGPYTNTTGAVSATTAGTGNVASDTLDVAAANPAVGLLKQVGTSPTGPWTSYVTVAPGTSLYYKFTVENIGDVTLASFNVTDPTLAGTAADPLTCVWQTINVPSTLPALPVASQTLDPTATCAVGPIVAAAGDHVNVATAHGTFAASTYDSQTSSAEYLGAVPGFSLLKQIASASTGPWSTAITVAAGADVYYKFTLINTGGTTLTSIGVTDPLVSTASCTFTDPLAAGNTTICIVGPVTASGAPGATKTNTAVGNGMNGVNPVNTTPASASYTIAGASADLSITKTDGVTTVVAGASVIYTITASNGGPSAVIGATVGDTLPATLTGATWICVGSGGGTCTASGAGNIADFVNLPAGAAVTYTVSATLSPMATGTLANTATVTAPGGVTDSNPANNSATDTDAITAQADLSITKTDGLTTVVPGSGVSYTIVASNAGPSAVTGAMVADTLPAPLTGVTWTCVGSGGGTCTSSGAGNIADAVNLPVGANVTFTVTATLSPAASGTLTNTATVTAPGGVTDPIPGNNSATDTDTIAAQADLSITKIDGVTTVVPGGGVTYTIVASNAGPSDATGATVTDTLPATLTGAAWTCVGSGGGTCTASGSGNIADTVNLPAGSSVTYTVTATLLPAATGTLANTAVVTTPPGVSDPTPGNNSATDSDTITPQADLAITKTDGVATVVPGASVTYTISASNAGPSAVTGATVADALPATLTGATWTCTGFGGGTCTASGSGNINASVNLPVGATVTFTVAATLSPAATGTLVNTAVVTAPGGVIDPNPGNNSAADADTITPQADLAITKTDGVTTVIPGSPVTYTIVATNAGPSAVTGASVMDTVPPALTGATWTCVGSGGGTCTASGSGNVADTVNLPAGASVTYTLNATLSPSATGTLTNTAVITAPGGVIDPNPVNNSATDTDTITPQADLSITKTDGVTTAVPGGSVTYTIAAANAGPSAVTGATVTDTLPAVLTGATWTCAGAGGGTCAASGSGNISASVNLPVGATVTFTVTATLSPTATGTLVNTATVATPGGVTDPNPGNNSATDTDTITPQSDLSITKTDGVTAVVPGGSVTYTIVAANAGPSAVTGATVTDTLAAALTGATWTCAGAGGGACAASGSGNVSASVNLPVGATVTFTVNATLSPAATGTLANTATVTAPPGVTDPNPGNNSATDTDTISAQANLTVTKTDGSATYLPGGVATYTVVVGNTGVSNAANVTVADPLPAGVTLSANATCVATGSATCGTVTGATGQASFGTTGATIAAGAGNTLTFTAPVSFAAGMTANPLVNTVTASDPASPAATASDSDVRGASADLTIAKTGPAQVLPGGAIQWLLTIGNLGPSAADGATFSDALPAGVTNVKANCGSATGGAVCGGVSVVAGVVSGTVTVLPVGGGVVVTITANAPASGASSLANIASVSPPAGTTDPTGGNNSSSATTQIGAATTVTPVPADAPWALLLLTLLIGAAATRRAVVRRPRR